MRPRDVAEAGRIDAALRTFHETTHPLPGIEAPAHRDAFLEQVIESIHRVRYVARVLEHTGGNKQAASRVLGVDRKTLDRMIKRHNIEFQRRNHNQSAQPSQTV